MADTHELLPSPLAGEGPGERVRCSARRCRLVPRNRTDAPGQAPIPFALSLPNGGSTKVLQQGFDRLSPNGKDAVRSEPNGKKPFALSLPPFALSLSKGASAKVIPKGFDRLSPNGFRVPDFHSGKEVPG